MVPAAYTKNKNLMLPRAPEDQLRSLFKKWSELLNEAETCFYLKKYESLSQKICKVIEGITGLVLISGEISANPWGDYLKETLLMLTRFSATGRVEILSVLKKSFIQISECGNS